MFLFHNKNKNENIKRNKLMLMKQMDRSSEFIKNNYWIVASFYFKRMCI